MITNFKSQAISEPEKLPFIEVPDIFTTLDEYATLQQSLNVFFNSPDFFETIEVIPPILSSFKSNNVSLKTYLDSLDFVSRILYLINSQSQSPDNLFFHPDVNQTFNQFEFIFSFEIEQIGLIIELINTILSNNPNSRNPQFLTFCLSFLDFYFDETHQYFGQYFQIIHFLLDSFIHLVSKDLFFLLTKDFFCKIEQFTQEDPQLHFDLTKIAERISLFIPIDNKFRFYFDFLKRQLEFADDITSLNLATCLRNIVRTNPSFISREESWSYQSLIFFLIYGDYDTQKVAIEICSSLHHDYMLSFLLNTKKVKSAIISIISQDDFEDIRLIPAIHLLNNFLEKCPLESTKKFVTKKGCNNLVPFLIKFINEGAFHLKVEAGFLLARTIQKIPSHFTIPFFNELSPSQDEKMCGLLDSIKVIFDVNNSDQLLIEMMVAIASICDELSIDYNPETLLEINQIFHSTEIWRQLVELAENESEQISALSKQIIDYFHLDE